MSGEKGKPSGEERRPKWWRRFWPPTIISCSVLIIVQCILCLLGYIDMSKLCGGILVLVAVTPLVYALWYIKTRISIETQLKIYRIAFIAAGACGTWAVTFFGGAFILWATGWHFPTYWRPWIGLFLFFIAPLIVGAFIGDRLGKRRGYRPFM